MIMFKIMSIVINVPIKKSNQKDHIFEEISSDTSKSPRDSLYELINESKNAAFGVNRWKQTACIVISKKNNTISTDDFDIMSSYCLNTGATMDMIIDCMRNSYWKKIKFKTKKARIIDT